MFGNKRKGHVESNRLTSLVAANMEISGDIEFQEGVRIDGSVSGNVFASEANHSLFVLSRQGRIKGNVKAYDAVIDGEIEGNLEVEHYLELQSNARITGEIIYRQLSMECGASVSGRLQHVGASTGSAQVVEIAQAAAAAHK